MACFNIPGDLALNDGETDLVFVQGVIAVAQQIRTGLQVFKGTWVYDQNAGTIDPETFFEKGADLRVYRSIIWEFLRSIPGVATVQAIDLRVEAETRTLFVDFRVIVESGEVLEESLGLEFRESI